MYVLFYTSKAKNKAKGFNGFTSSFRKEKKIQYPEKSCQHFGFEKSFPQRKSKGTLVYITLGRSY